MPKADIDLNRLTTAIRYARRGLQSYRENRRAAVREYVGAHWADGADHIVPVNLLSLYVSVVGRNLIAKNPRVMLSTFRRQHKPMVTAMQDWANKEIEHIHLANTLQRIVVDGLFSIGIAKVCLATPADSATVAWNLKAGQPTISRVDLDDFVFDIHARDFTEVSFIGHRYRAPLEVIRASKDYSKKRKDIQPSTDRVHNEDGDERISALGRGDAAFDSEEFEDFVDLWEVYVPRHRAVYTLLDDDIIGATAEGADGTFEVLRVQDWLGPESGPYRMLAYGVVPGNAMPKAPIQDLYDLHVLVNNLYRKLMRQAERQKEVLPVSGGATEDGQRVVQTADGEAFRCDNPDKIKPVNFGGPNAGNLAFAIQGWDLFSRHAGNLELMGGLSAQSKTATQDTMLNENASRAISDMQDRTIQYTSDVLKSLCWYWHHDPQKVMKSQFALPGLPEVSILRRVSPEQRQQVPFEDLDIRVDPYSLQHQTPQSRLAALNQVMTQIVMPMLPMLQPAGITVDFNVYLQKVATYLDMPDLTEIITMQEPPETDTKTPEGPSMPQSTTRNYVRENRPGRTRQGNDMNLVNKLMGADGSENGQMNGAA